MISYWHELEVPLRILVVCGQCEIEFIKSRGPFFPDRIAKIVSMPDTPLKIYGNKFCAVTATSNTGDEYNIFAPEYLAFIVSLIGH